MGSGFGIFRDSDILCYALLCLDILSSTSTSTSTLGPPTPQITKAASQATICPETLARQFVGTLIIHGLRDTVPSPERMFHHFMGVSRDQRDRVVAG